MHPATTRSAIGWRRIALSVVTGALLVGCGGAATPSPAAPSAASPGGSPSAQPSVLASPVPATPAATASPSPAGSPRPATAVLAIEGAKGMAGTLTKPSIRCAEPTFDGLTIDIFAQPIDPAVLDRVVVSEGKVTIRLAAGSGTAYTERDFMGTGVTGFEATTGAQIDTTLTEVTATGVNRGTIGAITSLKGSVACNDQRSGTTTLRLTADLAEGHLDGAIDPASVVCAADRTSVSILGLTSVGTTPVLVLVNLARDHFTVNVVPKGSPNHFYKVDAPGVVSVAADGAHATGDAVEQNSSGTARTLHFDGDATCG